MENSWTIEQTKRLFTLAKQSINSGKGLATVFSTMASETNRSCNSVRNYYYSQLKMFELVPQIANDLGISVVKGGRGEFELFTQDEINDLIKRVLIGKANGKSVRKVILELADFNPKKALRLQNKYRSMIAHHKQQVMSVMRLLANENAPYYNPYLKRVTVGEPTSSFEKLTDYVSALTEEEAGEFLSVLKKLFA